MNKMRRPYTYITQLTAFEQVLFWGGTILVILLLVDTLWFLLHDENPGDGSKYYWIFPIIFMIASLNLRLIVRAIKITESKRPLTNEEQTYLSHLQKNLSQPNKQPPAFLLTLRTINKWLSILLIVIVGISLLWIILG